MKTTSLEMHSVHLAVHLGRRAERVAVGGGDSQIARIAIVATARVVVAVKGRRAEAARRAPCRRVAVARVVERKAADVAVVPAALLVLVLAVLGLRAPSAAANAVAVVSLPPRPSVVIFRSSSIP